MQLASIKSMLEAPKRKGAPRPAASPTIMIDGLTKDTNDLLRQLAELSLDALGVEVSENRLHDEMHRHLRAIVPALGSGPDSESRLRSAIAHAIADYD